MKDIRQLKTDLGKMATNVKRELKKAQRETAEQIRKDAQLMAPGNGPYAQSIMVRKTVVDGNNISTKISTTVMTEEAKSTGKQYNLGFLLETGTNPHAIPNAFDWGRIYGYDSDMYKRTLAKDWHPGFVAMPHFIPAMNRNKALYRAKISEALRRVQK